jgi:ribonucleoside-triphosphate reductase
LENCAVEGSCIDVDTEQGFERARELQILAAPTVVVFDEQGNEIARAHTAQELSVVFEPALELSLA